MSPFYSLKSIVLTIFRGWGVLALPSNMFAPTPTYLETFGHTELGVRLEACPRESVFDITQGMSHVADGHKACSFPKAKALISSVSLPPTGSQTAALSYSRHVEKFDEEEALFEDTIKTMNKVNDVAELTQFRDRIGEFVCSSMILFTDRHDVRLIMSTGAQSTICQNIVRHDLIRGGIAFPNHDWDHNRLNIVAAIPSLSLGVYSYCSI